MNGISLFQQLIKRQTTAIGSGVSNIHGRAAQQLVTRVEPATGSWTVVGFDQRQSMELGEVLLAWGAGDRKSSVVVASGGVVSVSATPSQAGTDGIRYSSWLFHGGVEIVNPMTAWLQIATPDGGALFAVYLDGVLQRRAGGQLTLPLALDAGTHSIDVLANAGSVALSLPSDLLVRPDLDKLAPPVVDDTAGAVYTDSTTGTQALQLSWAVDARAGGWLVLRRIPEDLGTITTVASGDAYGTARVVVSGDVTDKVAVGSSLYAGRALAGSILALSFVSPVTNMSVRVADGQDRQAENWLGRRASTSDFSEVARVRRGPSGLSFTWNDATVPIGIRVEYLIRAYSLFNPDILSPPSSVSFVHTADTAPPGSIAFLAGYPKVINGRAQVRYTPPADKDYRGVNVKYRLVGTSGTATDASTVTTLQDTSKTWAVNQWAGYVVYFASGAGAGQVVGILSNTSNTLTFTGSVPVAPTHTTTYEVTAIVPVMTDVGHPGVLDELTFVPSGTGTYIFQAFDHYGNEQPMSGAPYWAYTGSGDIYVSPSQPPILGMRQLTSGEQAYMVSPYGDGLNYAVLELSGYDIDQATGQMVLSTVVIEYRTRGMSGFTDGQGGRPSGIPATATGFVQGTPNQPVDNPSGTRRRLVALSRAESQNWLEARAKDADGLYSGLFTYTADYDRIPEVSYYDAFINPITDYVELTVVVDDDTQSFRWTTDDGATWVVTNDSSQIKTYYWTQHAKLALGDGAQFVLKIEPYSGVNITGDMGDPVTTELSRPPRTTGTFEPKDEAGATSAVVVRATFDCFPDPAIEVTGKVNAAGSPANTTLKDTTKNWTVNAYMPVPSTRSMWYAVLTDNYWELAGGGQARRIVSNTSNTLTIEPAWDVAPISGANYAIMRGGTQWSRNGGGFKGTWGPAFFQRSFSGDLIEYYSELHGLPQEAIKRAYVDGDILPSISMTAFEVAANVLQVDLANADDDTRDWIGYARKGTWPTIGGIAPASGGVPDITYRRWELPVTETQLTFGVGTGTWYLIGVPENSYGEKGAAVALSVSVVGSGVNQGVLSNRGVVANDDGTSASYNKVYWDHNSPASGTWTVRVYAYRQDLGPGTTVEVTTGARDWSLDVGANFINSDDTNTLAGKGSLLHSLPALRGSPGVGTQYTWVYSVDLFKNGVVQTTYTITNTDWYLGVTTQFAGGSSAVTSEYTAGVCAQSQKGYWYGDPPYQLQTTWDIQAGTENDTDYYLEARYCYNTPVNIQSSSNATINTTTAHGYSSGMRVFIDGHTGNTAANGYWVITYVDSDTFTLNGYSGSGTGGATGKCIGDFTYPWANLQTTVEQVVWNAGETQIKGGDVNPWTAYPVMSVAIIRKSDGAVVARKTSSIPAGVSIGGCDSPPP